MNRMYVSLFIYHKSNRKSLLLQLLHDNRTRSAASCSKIFVSTVCTTSTQSELQQLSEVHLIYLQINILQIFYIKDRPLLTA